MLVAMPAFAKAQSSPQALLQPVWSEFTVPKTVFATDEVELLDTMLVESTSDYLQLSGNLKNAPNIHDNTCDKTSDAPHFTFERNYYSYNAMRNKISFSLLYKGGYSIKNNAILNDTFTFSYYKNKPKTAEIVAKMNRNINKKRVEMRYLCREFFHSDSAAVVFELKNNSADTLFTKISVVLTSSRAAYSRYSDEMPYKKLVLLPFAKIKYIGYVFTGTTPPDRALFYGYLQSQIKQNYYKITTATGAQSSVTKSDTSGVEDVPTIVFDYTVATRDSILQGNDRLFHFPFRNIGNTPLIIMGVKSSCGCLVPTYPKEPILPGQTGQIDGNYDTHRLGPFTKTITVTCNDPNNEIKVLTIKGIVFAKP